MRTAAPPGADGYAPLLSLPPASEFRRSPQHPAPAAFSLDVTADAPCDEGFPSQARPFERGTVTLLQGAPTMDLSELQQPLSTAGMVRSVAVIALAGATGVGCCYLAAKLTLVRTGELALVRSVSGDCRALGPGWHLIDTVTCDVVKASMTQPVVQLGNLTILRILPGELGKGQLNGQPLLLGPGVHLLNDPLFNFLGTSPATAPTISVANTLHVITVGREELGLCLANAQGHFLGPGRHAICHPRFEFRGLQSAKSEYLSVGAKHRVFLAEGRLGLAWEGGRPLVLEPKEDRTPHCFDSPTFAFERSVPATQQVIVHGSLKVITVRQGFVGVSFRDGALVVMPPGRDVLNSVTHAFSGFLPTGQQTMQLEAVDGMTSDNVGLKFDAAICVQIVDAKKAIMALSTTAESARRANTSGSDAGFDSDTIWRAVCSRARLALSIIIGNQRLNRGDGREEEDGHQPPYQPGRGGLPPVSLGPAPAESRALAAADAKLGGGGGGGGDAGDPAPRPESAVGSGKAPPTSFRTRIHDSCVGGRVARATALGARHNRTPTHTRAHTHATPPIPPTQLHGELCGAHAGRVRRGSGGHVARGRAHHRQDAGRGDGSRRGGARGPRQGHRGAADQAHAVRGGKGVGNLARRGQGRRHQRHRRGRGQPGEAHGRHLLPAKVAREPAAGNAAGGGGGAARLKQHARACQLPAGCGANAWRRRRRRRRRRPLRPARAGRRRAKGAVSAQCF